MRQIIVNHAWRAHNSIKPKLSLTKFPSLGKQEQMEYLVILNMLFIILSGFFNTNFCNMQENENFRLLADNTECQQELFFIGPFHVCVIDIIAVNNL